MTGKRVSISRNKGAIQASPTFLRSVLLIIGRIRNFIGIYSGRIGDDELKAQLGIVWKARVISEIIGAKKFGEIVAEGN